MAATAERTNTLPIWLAVATAALFVLRSSISWYERLFPPQPANHMQWLQADQADGEILKGKSAFLFLTHGSSCAKCKRFEQVLDVPSVAKAIRKRFVPVKCTIARDRADPPPEFQCSKSKWIYRRKDIPSAYLLPPTLWKTQIDDDDEFWVQEVESRLSPLTTSLHQSMENYSASMPLLNYGGVGCYPPQTALAQATKSKPALLMFVKTRDRHSDKERSLWFGENAEEHLFDKNFYPALVVDTTRTRGKNSKETEELCKRFGVTKFPTVVITGPKLPTRRFEEYPGKYQVREILSHPTLDSSVIEPGTTEASASSEPRVRLAGSHR